jgi:hypothetical protein
MLRLLYHVENEWFVIQVILGIIDEVIVIEHDKRQEGLQSDG